VARPLDDDTDTAARVAADLLETMRSFPGCVGIAAPQIDELFRVIAVDVSEHRKAPETAHGELVLVDPAVVSASGAKVAREGCLSLPHLTANVRRATSIVVSGRTPAGDDIEVESVDFEARCLLHEIDHLDGLLFLDRVDSLAADVFRRKTYR